MEHLQVAKYVAILSSTELRLGWKKNKVYTSFHGYKVPRFTSPAYPSTLLALPLTHQAVHRVTVFVVPYV